jgi:hypothetical protein
MLLSSKNPAFFLDKLQKNCEKQLVAIYIIGENRENRSYPVPFTKTDKHLFVHIRVNVKSNEPRKEK